MDAKRDSLWPIIAQTYGEHQTKLWWVRWRIFFMSCAELFGYKNGQEWWVTHYLFKPRL
jgi:cyclopropane-fatty-acyl-phospholipid synthase